MLTIGGRTLMHNSELRYMERQHPLLEACLPRVSGRIGTAAKNQLEGTWQDAEYVL